MTQKFQFGDRVRHPKYGECMVVTQWYDADTDDPTWVSIISEEHGECDTRHEELELVPHPDTARLDFIDEFCVSLMFITQYDSHTKLNDYCRVTNEVSQKHYQGRDVRKAIDKAMQEQTP